MDRIDIARRFAQAQSALRMTGAELARALGTSASYISDIRAAKALPSLRIVAMLSKEFGIDANWILTGEGAEPIQR